ncbi:hypothetical protein [Tolypothrix sp. VBCCA 56010]|uniref:hypothetical protein n=1 Tax=Tolypothrix sp. VBCCA 56010 TaxID=3137731 RepID=UPI003D7EFE98
MAVRCGESTRRCRFGSIRSGEPVRGASLKEKGGTRPLKHLPSLVIILSLSRQFAQVGIPDGRCFKGGNLRNALPPQATGSPLPFTLFPSSKSPLPIAHCPLPIAHCPMPYAQFPN